MEAESPCGVSIVRGENLVIQTQTAKACEMIKKKLAKGEQYDKQQRPNHVRETELEDCERSGAALITECAVSDVGAYAAWRLFQLRAGLQDPQEVPEAWAAVFLIRRFRKVNQKVFEVGLVSQL